MIFEDDNELRKSAWLIPTTKKSADRPCTTSLAEKPNHSDALPDLLLIKTIRNIKIDTKTTGIIRDTNGFRNSR